MKSKLSFLILIGLLFVISSTYAQDPKLYIRYDSTIYAVPATQVTMDIQVWKPAQSATIEDAWSDDLPPNPANTMDENIISGYGSTYDIYSVYIYDNSGGSNHAYVGGTWGTSDDFSYKPNSSTYSLDVTFYAQGAHTAGIVID
ncbi:MAG: hypothetical protein U9R19_12455 [Bacteroidota bacterium]|nr:hypothetical protein [Bacteroidota bacterium]